MKFIRALPLFFLLLDGCIDPFPANLASAEKILVVDGMISDQPGPYSVKLFWSSHLTEDQSEPDMVRGASVSIMDDANETFQLTESLPGVYVTDSGAIKGELGKTYRLRISTTEGTEYQSSEEPLMPAGEIDSLYTAFEKNSINQTEPAEPQDALSFYVDGRQDPLNPGGFARWRVTGIYEIQTFPELRTELRENIRVPSPVPCSGYVNMSDDLVRVGPCTCCICWVYEYSREAVVSPTQLPGSNGFREMAVFRVPVDGWRFFYKYYLEVEQLSVSEDVYEFWKRISAQQKGTRSLFQPNVVKVKGNLRCISDPEREVFGVFAASAIVRKSIFINRRQLPKQIYVPGVVTVDCRFVRDNADNVRPPFW